MVPQGVCDGQGSVTIPHNVSMTPQLRRIALHVQQCVNWRAYATPTPSIFALATNRGGRDTQAVDTSYCEAARRL